MKKMLVILVLCGAMMNLSYSRAATATVNGITWTYTVSDGEAELDAYTVPAVITGAITIPTKLNGYPVTSIGKSAFSCCSGLTSVTIPDSVTYIGPMAFYGCEGLKSMTIPASVTIIEKEAFCDCGGLKSVTIPNSVISIGRHAFESCRGLTSVILPESVTGIEEDVFADCSGLVSVRIPNSVTYIGSRAFIGCSGLENVTIPVSVTDIGNYAFSYCDRLKSFSVGTENISYKSVNGLLLSKDGKTLVNGVNGEVTIPSSVTRIVSGAFSGCSGLASVTMEGDCPMVESYAFSGVNALCIVRFPPGNDTYEVVNGKWQGLKVEYCVSFNANGGEVNEGTRRIMHGNCIGALPMPVRSGYAFAGWFAALAGGDKVTDETIVTDALTLYARWEKYVVDAPIIAVPAGDAYYGESFEVSISCTFDDAVIYYSTNGVTPRLSDPYMYKGPFVIRDTTTVKAVAVFEDVRSDYVTVTISQKTLSLAEAVCSGSTTSTLSFATGGDAQWAAVTDATAAGEVSARSGMIGRESETWMQTTVTGAGVFSFNWKVDCEQDDSGDVTWDRVYVTTNCVEAVRIDGTRGWERVEFTFGDDIDHTIRWTFCRDGEDDPYADFADCAWVDMVSWFPKVVANVGVDEVKGSVVKMDDCYVVTAADGVALTENDIIFSVVAKEAYTVTIADSGKSATVTLNAPAFGAGMELNEAEAWKDESDKSGALVIVSKDKIVAKPAEDETVGAVPVNTYEGLWYQATWGNVLGNLTAGEKVAGTGEMLYLGVIKQTGEKGFYKVTVSEE